MITLKKNNARPFQLSVEDIKAVDIAWPTILLGLSTFVAFVVGVAAHVYWDAPWYLVIPWQTIAIFWSFTPLHEASHGIVATHSNYRWLNGFIGRLNGIPLAAPYPAFRHVHLEHHKHTNDPEKDPDHWAGKSRFGPILLPLSWVTLDKKYYTYIVMNLKQLKTADGIESLTVIISKYIFYGYCIYAGWFTRLAIAFIIPCRIAVIFLAMAFDYVPHRQGSTRAENIYSSTHKVSGYFFPHGLQNDFFLAIPLMNQHIHVVHHLYPRIPFYRYQVIWEKYKSEFIKAGTNIVTFYDSKTPWLSQHHHAPADRKSVV